MKRYFTVIMTATTFFLGMSAMPLYAAMSGGDMANSGGFGMMSGMAATPVVGHDGKAYTVSWTPNQNSGTMPNSHSFTSTLMAIDPNTGQAVSLILDGIVSGPVLNDDGKMLLATVSLPDFKDFHMLANLGDNNAESQSVLYAIALPLTENTLPIAVSLDESYASIPMIANGAIYVTTTNRGDFMLGRSMFEGMFGNFDFNNLQDQKSFLYIVNLNGTLKAKIEIK